MDSRWIFSAFPELLRLERAGDRRSVWRRAYGRVLGRPWYWLLAGAVQIGAQIALGIPAARGARRAGLPRGLIEFGVPLLVALLAVVLTVWIVRRAIVRRIRAELDARGMPTCLRCGYSLRDLPESVRRCPECGGSRRAAPAIMSDHPDDHPNRRR